MGGVRGGARTHNVSLSVADFKSTAFQPISPHARRCILRTYKKYTDEELIKAVKTSTSIAQVLKKLNLKPVGGNYQTVKNKIRDFELNTDHFLGQAANQGREFKPFGELKGRRAIRLRLINERGNCCEACGLHTWQDQPITLEVHHIDGDNQNNNGLNLQLLCPNCHSQTENFRNKK